MTEQQQWNIVGKRIYNKLYSHSGRSSSRITPVSDKSAIHSSPQPSPPGRAQWSPLYSNTDNNGALPTGV